MWFGDGYDGPMDTPGDRLRAARERKYDTQQQAADALGISDRTVGAHERGDRGISRVMAVKYAQAFRTTPEWILYGRAGSEFPDFLPTAEELTEMVGQSVNLGVSMGTKLGDLPAIIAPLLHEMLVQYRADREEQYLSGNRPAKD